MKMYDNPSDINTIWVNKVSTSHTVVLNNSLQRLNCKIEVHHYKYLLLPLHLSSITVIGELSLLFV